MCGIAGFVRSVAPAADGAVLKQMGDAIYHRGPDAGGEYLDDYVGLAHRRLSIIDLSEQGNQPMTSLNGRYVIVFNGEIYNFQQLRSELLKEQVQFRTRTDTEVLLELYQKSGADCLTKLNGMFAFAIWDREEKTLFLARDRVGKKPLYYYHQGGDRFGFASELKSLRQLPGIEFGIEPTSLCDFLKYHYIPAPKTIYRNVFKLLPGHSLTLKLNSNIDVSQYWDVSFGVRRNLTVEKAQEELLDLMKDSTAIRMIADVPLGAFLSGGVDSSAIVGLMSEISSDPVRTCTIGFDDKDHDESPYAKEMAELFSTNHQEFRVKSNLTETVDLLPRFLDEPFADSSAVPTYHVSRLARQAVTVALAGDGGDESFGGYSKYSVELKEDLVRKAVPRVFLKAINSLSRGFHHPLPRKAHSLTGSALSEPGRAFYRTNTYIDDRTMESVLPGSIRRQCSGYDPAEPTLRYYNKMGDADHVSRMLYTDLKTYLPDDILVKVDRMSMANSLEVRAPLLDYRIVEFAASLPSRFKIQGNQKKILLRDTCSKLLPGDILSRPKHGFIVPLESWFRDELKEYAESKLFSLPSVTEVLSLSGVKKIWQEHQSRKSDHGTILWSFLMLALWHNEYGRH